MEDGINSQKYTEAVGRSQLNDVSGLQAEFQAASTDTTSTPAGVNHIDYGNMAFGNSGNQLAAGSTSILEGLASGIGDFGDQFMKWGEYSASQDMKVLQKGLDTLRQSGADASAQASWLDRQNYKPTMFNQDDYANLHASLNGIAGYEQWQNATVEELMDLQNNPHSTRRINYGYEIGGPPLSPSAMVDIMNDKLSKEGDDTKKAWLSDKMRGYQDQMYSAMRASALDTFLSDQDNWFASTTMEMENSLYAGDPAIEVEDIILRGTKDLHYDAIEDPETKASLVRSLRQKAEGWGKSRRKEYEAVANQARAQVVESALTRLETAK